MQHLFLLFALAAFQPSAAFFILRHSPLVVTRLDPIISPGTVSQHEHAIVGGSKFSKDYSYADALTASCTTAPVSIDKSMYWAPQLYYVSPDRSSFQAIPFTANTYYLQRPGSKNEKIVQPPAGLKMLAGNPGRRSFNSSSFAQQAVSFVCLDYYNDHTGDAAWEQRNSFFEHNCPDGMRAQVFFPSCWDGKNLYKSDQTHMAYPVDSFQGGNCPSTHPVHIISIFYEWVYSVGDFPYNGAGKPTWALANGDTTGYGFHGDFAMGWPTGANSVLQQAIDTCGLETGGNIDACAAFTPVIDYAAAAACQPEGLVINEPNGLSSPIPKLPGDNPLWTTSSTTKPSTKGYVESATYVSPSSTIPANWSLLGCVAEPTSGRALNAASTTSSTMTVAKCIAFCAKLGLALSGTEYGSECYCDSAFRNGASSTTVSSDQCSVICSGLATENCGGSSKLTVYQNPKLNVAPVLTSGWAVHTSPCMTDSGTTRALSDATMSASNMTVPICVAFCDAKGFAYAGLEYGQECWCGQKFSADSKAVTDGSCNMACKGQLSQTCGGSSRLSVYANPSKASTSSSVAASSKSSSAAATSSTSKAATATASSTAAAATTFAATGVVIRSGTTQWQSQGCVTDGSKLLLQDLKQYFKGNTPAVCIAACLDAGYTYAGVELGTRCLCSNSLYTDTGLGAKVADSECQESTCPGDGAQFCGGTRRMILFKQLMPAYSTKAITSGGTQWSYQGCVQDGSKLLLQDLKLYRADNSPAACIALCRASGYSYAGVELQTRCVCGSSLNTASGLGGPLDDSRCQETICPGDTLAYCGGNKAMILYKQAGSSSVSKRASRREQASHHRLSQGRY